MQFKAYSIALPILLILTSCATPPPAPKVTYADPEKYLMGKSIEEVGGAYGNPSKTNSLGKTLFVTYTSIATVANHYSNICFLELQADNGTKIIKKVSLGSNLFIDSNKFPIDVRQDCNRAFYKADLAK